MVLPANKGNSHKVTRSEGNSPTGGKEMGLVYVEIELLSVDDLALLALQRLALVSTLKHDAKGHQADDTGDAPCDRLPEATGVC